jgi:hypothetical protein
MQHSHKVIVLVNTPTPPGHKTSESKGGVFGNIRSAGLGNTNSAVLGKMKADFEVGSKERPADSNPTRTRYVFSGLLYSLRVSESLADVFLLQFLKLRCKRNRQLSRPIRRSLSICFKLSKNLY